MKDSKVTKRALFSSVMSLLLCVSMLIGTTFAWFTDTARTGINKIQAGTLDVMLVDENGNSLEGQTLEFDDEDENKLWEPGATYKLQDVYVKNNGNVSIKYTVEVTGINGDAKLNEAIEWDINGVENGTLNAGETSQITITGHMEETAGNEYQGLSIDGISITVYATQHTGEFDSNTNEYDKDAEYPDAYYAAASVNGVEYATFAQALEAANGQTIKLNKNIKLTEDFVVNNNETVSIDLNNYTMYATDSTSGSNQIMFDVRGTLSLSNGNIEYGYTGVNMAWNHMSTIFNVTAGGVLNMDGVNATNLGGTDMNFVVHLNNWGEVTLNANNSVLNAPYCAVRVFNSGPDMNHVTIKNSTLTGNTRAFWVQVANDDRLDFDIFNNQGNNNTFNITGNAKAPIRINTANGNVYYNANGEVVE